MPTSTARNRIAIAAILGLFAAAAAVAQEGIHGPDAKQVARRVGALLEQDSDTPSREHSNLLNDVHFLRRAALDIVGRPPTPEELTLFALNPDAAKRDKAVQRMLASAEFARNWGRYWRDVVLAGAEQRNAIVQSQTVEAWFAAQLATDRGWNEVVEELLTATGDSPAAAFLIAYQGRADKLAAVTSRVFLGIRMECAQCHDHPYDGWKREQFHQLAAFFPRVGVRRNGKGKMNVEVVFSRDAKVQPPPNKKGQKSGPLEHHMPDSQDPTRPGTLMQPVLFATGKSPGAGISDVARRRFLAESITNADNPLFAKSVVNRVWAEMLGRGFVEPIDDMGPNTRVRHTRVLDMLASGFSESGYRTKWLVRAIALTRAYQSVAAKVDDARQAAVVPTRLKPEQIASALTAALGTTVPPRPFDPRRYLKGGRPATGEDLVALFGTDPSIPSEEVTGTVPQALFMMNAPVINSAIDSRGQGALANLLLTVANDDALIGELYLRVLARRPSDHEFNRCRRHIAETADRDRAFEDILWCLINSAEFLLNR